MLARGLLSTSTIVLCVIIDRYLDDRIDLGCAPLGSWSALLSGMIPTPMSTARCNPSGWGYPTFTLGSTIRNSAPNYSLPLMQFLRPLAPLLYWFSVASLLASCSEEAPRIQVYHPLPRTSTGYARRAVLITCDALRPDMLGAYGNRRGLTPNLDRLSEEAIVYDQTFAPSTITVPSLSSMFTGLTPRALGGELQNQMLVPESVDTFTEILAAGGGCHGGVRFKLGPALSCHDRGKVRCGPGVWGVQRGGYGQGASP